MIRIPTFTATSSDFEFDIELGGEVMNLRFTWNIRNEFWHCATTRQDGTTYGTFKVVPNWPLWRQSAALTGLVGSLIVLKDDASAPTEIDYDSFGTSWGLYYMDAAELQAWEVENGLR